MNDDTQKVEVSIMGKSYFVFCTPQQQEELTKAVELLNSRVEKLKRTMRSKKSSEVTTRDSLLAIVALNLSYELLRMNNTVSSGTSETDKLIKRIKGTFDQPDLDDDPRKFSEISL